MTRSVKIILISMATLVVAGIAYSSFSGENKIKNIKSNPKEAHARVFDKFIPKVSSSGIKDVTYQSRYKYEFLAEGKRYEGLSDRYYFSIQNQNAIMNQGFTVIYDGKDPANSCLLILKRDYQEFGLQQPDSLKHYEDLLD